MLTKMKCINYKKIIECFMLTLIFTVGFYYKIVCAAEFTDAIPIQLNQTVSGALTKGARDEQDFYMFTTSYPGSVTINFVNPMQNSSDAYWHVVLYNWEYKELFDEMVYGNRMTTDLIATGIPAGSYYVKVESSGYSEVKSEDNYSISVNYTMSDTWEKELNDEFTTASFLNLNCPYYGTTSAGSRDEQDYYYFVLEEAGNMTLNFSNPLQSDASDYWQVYLFDKEYRQIYCDSICGNVESTNLPATGLDAGKYYIKVESAGYSDVRSTEIYTLTLNFQSSDRWEKERNEDYTTATSIETDVTYFGTTSAGSRDERDYYRVNIPEDGNYTIQFDTQNQRSSDCFWQVYLFDSAYTELSSVNVYGNKTANQINQKLNADTYYILVESSGYSEVKSTDVYELLVTKKAVVQSKPKKVTLKSAKAGKNMATISWNKLTGVSGYEVYMSRSKSGGYTRVKMLSATSYKKRDLISGKRYYFKVRAYKSIDGRKMYGAFSSVKSALIK